jgi:hypothetical protein
MSKRDPAASVQLHFRVREDLRAALEDAAKHNGQTLSAEITNRLADSFLKLDHASLIRAGSQLIHSATAVQVALRTAGALARDLQDDKHRARAVQLVLDLNELQGKLFEPLQTLMVPRPDKDHDK